MTVKTVDNYERIRPFIQNKESGNSHLIQFINRQKNNDSRTSTFKDIVYLEKLDARIKEYRKAAWVLNCRIYINLNYFSNQKVLLNCAKRCIDHYATYTGGHVLNSIYSELGKATESKLYLADLDDLSRYEEVLNAIGDNLITLIPSVSGMHLIFKPYDFRNLTGLCSVHKNNPTILFASEDFKKEGAE